MTENYFRTLFLCMVGSLILLVTSHALWQGRWFSLVAGCGPLVYSSSVFRSARRYWLNEMSVSA